MKRVVLAGLLAFGLAACGVEGEQVENANGGAYRWTYMDGPRGEECLVAEYWVGGNTGVAMMDCRWPNE